MTTKVTNKQLSDAIEKGMAKAATMGLPDWHGATDELIELLVTNGECFSSGEIAAHLRTFRPDLRFSVTASIGEHVRERFYGDAMPRYTLPDGSSVPVEMVPRTTGGFTRTPIGTQVFVYGPSVSDATMHPFEVEIPAPGVQVPADPGDAHGLPARPAQAATPIQPVALTPKPSTAKITASIHTDTRCCVPRAAFEALLHATQTSLKGGDLVYVEVEGDKAIVSLDIFPGALVHHLAAERGRVLFTRPNLPFTPGDAYEVQVDGANRRLVVDLSKTV